MTDIVYWSSSSRNTERFVNRLGVETLKIASNMGRVVRPFYLAMPTYDDGTGRGAVPKPVIRFLNQPENRALLKGVIGGGNRNFGERFCIGAKIAAEKCGVPVIYLFELAGTDYDVEQIRNRIIGT
mgnify:CR=1 FL=1